MQVVVSTLAFMGMQTEDIVRLAQKNNWALEFSSGMPYREDMETFFLQAAIQRYAHNYFPAPKVPFVLNLASANETIRKTSVAHCIQGLQLSKAVGAPFFSAHAGFCLDPSPDDLGRKLVLNSPFNRNKHWELFTQSLQLVLDQAERLNIGFLIENNVLAAVNIHPDGSNPLFCCDAAEMLDMLKEIKHPKLGLLIDTAHLKVSAHTLGFNQEEALKQLSEQIVCLHHSDNDGNFDTNDKLTTDYWFLPFLNDFQKCTHVLEVKKLSENEIIQQIKLLQS